MSADPTTAPHDSWGKIVSAADEQLTKAQRLGVLEDRFEEDLKHDAIWKERVADRLATLEKWQYKVIGAIACGSFLIGVGVTILFGVLRLLWK